METRPLFDLDKHLIDAESEKQRTLLQATRLNFHIHPNVVPALDSIRVWLFKSLGFNVSRHEALSFALHTMHVVPEAAIETIRFMKIIPRDEYIFLSVQRSLYNKIKNFVAQNPLLPRDANIIVNAIILFRSQTLPVLCEPLQFQPDSK